MHGRVVKDVADVRGVPTGRELDDGRHQLDRVDIPGPVHQRGFGFLAARAPDDQHTLPGIAFQIVRRQHPDLPEVLVDTGLVVVEVFP